jgi:hypothetical protein
VIWFKRHASRGRAAGRSPRVRQIRYYEPAEDPLGLEIQRALKERDPDGRLRQEGCEPQPDGPEFDCYCAVGAGAYFFLKGEELAGIDALALAPVDAAAWAEGGRTAREAGYQSACSDGGGHWWLERRQDDTVSHVIDLNIGLNDPNDDFPYEDGHLQGFRLYGYKRPSPRAHEVIQLVKEARANSQARDSK